MSLQQYPKTQGIYKIINTKDNKFYIGSSKQLNKRIIDHFSRLRNNKHKNKFLQRAFNKYGECFFKVKILEESVGLSAEELLEKEQFYLDSIKDWRNCYNQTRDTKYAGKILIEESERRKNKITSLTGKNNPFYGKTHSEETKKLLCEKHLKSGSGITKKKNGRFEVKIKRSYVGTFKTHEEALKYRLIAEKAYYEDDKNSKNILKAIKKQRVLPEGVYFVRGKFCTKLIYKKHQYQLGTFDNCEIASEVYQQAKIKLEESEECFLEFFKNIPWKRKSTKQSLLS